MKLFNSLIITSFIVAPLFSFAANPDRETEAALTNSQCTQELMKFCEHASHRRSKNLGSGDLAACVQMNRQRFSKSCVKATEINAPTIIPEEEINTDEKFLTLMARGGFINQDFSKGPTDNGSGPFGGVAMRLHMRLIDLRPGFSLFKVGKQDVRDTNWTRFQGSARVWYAVLHDLTAQSGDNQSYHHLMVGLGYPFKLPIVGELTPSLGYANTSTDLASLGKADGDGFYAGIRIFGQNCGFEHEISFAYAHVSQKFSSDNILKLHGRIFYGFGGFLRFGPEASVDIENYLLRELSTVRLGVRVEI